ncbi:MAG TPA: FkbM family methyltransferase [Acidimicrobiia bacterium]|nr:FkbM family methyltransferase [Acidimicrobiia bacterium]
MGEQTVRFRPFDGWSFSISGSDQDAGVVGEIERSGGSYQPDLTRLLRRRLRRDDVVIDGGAHIGVLTVLMAKLCPAGHVYAFEPSPATRAHLTANLLRNGAGNVTVEAAALYDREGEVTFDPSTTQPGGAHLTASATGTATVAATPLDTWAAAAGLERLDFVKLDVEGTELAVLAGAEATIRRFRPTAVVECNPVALRRFGGRSYRDLFDALRSLFPAVGLVGPGGTVVPLGAEGRDHLELAVGDRGVVDLVGLPARPGPLEAVRGQRRARADLRRLRQTHDPSHLPATNMNFVIEPGIGIVAGVAEAAGPPGGSVGVPVTVANRTRWWLSSSFEYVPIHVAYRLLDEAGDAVVAEGHRTVFPEPLAPGGEVDLVVGVELPAAPGRYELVLTPVQEFFTWFDEIDPGCTARLPVVVQSLRAT